MRVVWVHSPAQDASGAALVAPAWLSTDRLGAVAMGTTGTTVGCGAEGTGSGAEE